MSSVIISPCIFRIFFSFNSIPTAIIMVNCVTESLPNWLWCTYVYCVLRENDWRPRKTKWFTPSAKTCESNYRWYGKKTLHLNTRKSFGCVFIFMQFFRFSHLQITVGNVKVDRGRTEGRGNGDVETDNGGRRVTSVFFGKASAKTTVQNVGQTR